MHQCDGWMPKGSKSYWVKMQIPWMVLNISFNSDNMAGINMWQTHDWNFIVKTTFLWTLKYEYAGGFF